MNHRVRMTALVPYTTRYRSVRFLKRRWTTQKTFHALHFACATLRALVFSLRENIDDAFLEAVSDDETKSNKSRACLWTVIRNVAFDVPCLLFFTAYALLVLFWAEMYYRARGKLGSSPRRAFYGANLVLYVTLGTLWIAGGVVEQRSAEYNSDTHTILQTTAAGIIAVSALAIAALFLKYGGSLWIMLNKFPTNAKGRRKKLREIGIVTSICVLCFSARAAAVIAEAVFLEENTKTEGLNGGGFLDQTHPKTPFADVAYYVACELFPAVTALFVLRKLPPKAREGASRDDPPRRGDENA